MKSYRGISLLVGLNWDRIIAVATVLAGLVLGALLGQVLLQV
jgi:hypothetical protein